MPLLKYFGFVSSALLVLMFGLNWILPQAADGPVRSGVDRTVIRISSIERLPEPVVMDTSLPTIVPPPSTVDVSQQPLHSTSVENSSQEAISDADEPIQTKQSRKKREPVKKVAARRAPSAVRNELAAYHSVQAAAPVMRMSLLDIIKERLGQSLFKLN